MDITSWVFFWSVIVISILAVALPLVSEAWNARPSAKRAREVMAERRAQSEARRIILIGQERQARAQDTALLIEAIVGGILASTRELPPPPLRTLSREERHDLIVPQTERIPLDPERVKRNLAAFFRDVSMAIAPRLLEEKHSPERVLAYRAALRRAEIQRFCSQDDVTPPSGINVFPSH